MRVMVSTGNAPGLPTGYGTQSLLQVRAALRDPENDVVVLAWNLRLASEVAVSTDDMLRLAPMMRRVLAQLPPSEAEAWRARVTWLGTWYTMAPPPVIHKAALNARIVRNRVDLLWVLQDPFIFEPGPLACPSVLWLVPHFGPPWEKPLIRAAADFTVILGISAHGAHGAQLYFGGQHGAHAMKHIEYIPHGRDAAVFTPTPYALDGSDHAAARHREHQEAARRRFGWPTRVAAAAPTAPAEWLETGGGWVHVTVILLSNSEKSGRKALDAQVQGWIEFARRRERDGYPRDATFLVLHCEAVRAYDVPRLLEALGEFRDRPAYEDLASRHGLTVVDDPTQAIRGERFLIVPPAQVNAARDADVAAMLQAADVYLGATAAEGCGIPGLEAQLCGTPAVTHATTAMTEQTLYGIAVEPGQHLMRVDFQALWRIPAADHIADALYATSRWSHAERAARLRAVLPELRARYDAAPVVDKLVNFLRRVQRDIVIPWQARVRPLAPYGQQLGKTRAAAAAAIDTPHTKALLDETEHAQLQRHDFVRWLALPPVRIGTPPAQGQLAASTRVQYETTALYARYDAAADKAQQEARELWRRIMYVDGAAAQLSSIRNECVL